MRRLGLVLLACATLLTGCGSASLSAIPAGTEATFKERAAAVASAWQESGVHAAWATGLVPLQALTVEPDWSPNGDLKAAFGNGWIRSSSPLPDATGSGDIRFADGTSLHVPLVGAHTAYDGLPPRTGPCPMSGQPPTCQWVTITGAQMSTVEINTTRGKVVVPAWNFTVKGLTRPLTEVAVAPSAVATLPEVPLPDQQPPEGLASAMSLVSVAGDIVSFTIGIGACDKDPRGLVHETPELVVVGGSATPADAGTVCTQQLLSHPVEVRTKAPIGSRLIVDAMTAQPLLTQPALSQP